MGETRLPEQLSRVHAISSRIDLKDLLLRYQEQESQGRRPGLSASIFNHLRSYGPVTDCIIDPPSSDENSDVESGCPSLRTTIDSILDSHLCELTDTFVPVTYHQPALIVLNIPTTLTQSSLKATLADLCTTVWKSQIVDFPVEARFCRCGIVYLENEATAEKIYGRLKEEEESGALDARFLCDPSPLSHPSLRWFRNLSLDPASPWAAIVLRDLSKSTTAPLLLSLLRDQCISPIRLEAPRPVNAGTCALAVLETVEAAEKACKVLHKKVWLGAIWKVHVHPRSHGGVATKKGGRAKSEKRKKGSGFDYDDLYQMMRSDHKGGVESVANEDPLKRLVRKRAPRAKRNP